MGGRGLVDRQEVPIPNPGIAHTLADYRQEIVRARPEQGRIDLMMGSDMGMRKQGLAGRHAPDHGDAFLASIRHTDTARTPGGQDDHTLARQRPYMLLGGIDGPETQGGGDLGARGRSAGGLDLPPDPIQNLLLAPCKNRHTGNIYSTKAKKKRAASLPLPSLQKAHHSASLPRTSLRPMASLPCASCSLDILSKIPFRDPPSQAKPG